MAVMVAPTSCGVWVPLKRDLIFDAGPIGIDCSPQSGRVITVLSDGTAQQAGVQEGWRIVGIDGRQIEEGWRVVSADGRQITSDKFEVSAPRRCTITFFVGHGWVTTYQVVAAPVVEVAALPDLRTQEFLCSHVDAPVSDAMLQGQGLLDHLPNQASNCSLSTEGTASTSPGGTDSISQLASEEEHSCEFDRAFGSASMLSDNEDNCKRVIKELLTRHVMRACHLGCTYENRALLMWLLPAFKKLALSSESSSRVAQKALEVASPEDQDALIAQISASVDDLYKSDYGNFLLRKAIEVSPEKSDFISTALLEQAVVVSKHRFGCRIIGDLIQCEVPHVSPLLDKVIAEAESLSSHFPGCYVVESIFKVDHMACRRVEVLSKLLPHFNKLARSKGGSIVVQRVLSDGNDGEFAQAVKALPTNGLFDLACSKYGSHVVKRWAMLRRDNIADVLLANKAQLSSTHACENVLPVLEQLLDPRDSCASAKDRNAMPSAVFRPSFHLTVS